MENRICKRCLLREMDGTYYQSIYDYIDNLPEETKVDAEEYARRISRCKACGDLINGMCVQCGCYVEVRAAKRRMHCARSETIW